MCAPWKSLYYERAHTRVRPYTVKEASLTATFALTESLPAQGNTRGGYLNRKASPRWRSCHRKVTDKGISRQRKRLAVCRLFNTVFLFLFNITLHYTICSLPVALRRTPYPSRHAVPCHLLHEGEGSIFNDVLFLTLIPLSY